MDLKPICHPSPVIKKLNACFWIMFNFWWLAGLVDGLERHLPPLSSHKSKMLIFRLCSTSDDRSSWSMDLNPVCHLSSSQKNKMLTFGLHSTSDDRLGWSMDLNPICHPSPAKKKKAHFWITFNFWWSAGLVDGLESCMSRLSSQKIKCSILDYVQLLMIGRTVDGLEPHLPPLCSQKNEMLIFGLRSTSDDRLGWSMNSNPSTTPLQPKK